MNISPKVIFIIIIMLNFSCLSKNQNPDLAKVKPLQPVNQSWNEIEGNQVKLNDNNQTQENSDWKQIELVQGEKAELTSADIFQGKNLSEYEQGGYFYCGALGLAKNKPEIKCNKSKIRDFIWKHWIEKKRGYIRFTHDGIDVTFTEHIFVEPNKEGDWKVIWKVIRNQVTAGIKVTKINSVIQERGELVFKNENGEIIRKL